MKRVYLLRFAKITAFLLALLILIEVLPQTIFLRQDHDVRRIRGFYDEPENSLDVVFIGASDVYRGYSPAQAYKQYKFTSYLYGEASLPCTLYLTILKEILCKQNPQLIMVEVSGFIDAHEEYMHSVVPYFNLLEGMPNSQNKREMIANYEVKNIPSILFPFFRYHGTYRLKTIPDSLNYLLKEKGKPSCLKGVQLVSTNMSDCPIYTPPAEYPASDLLGTANDALLEFITYCKEMHLENKVIFVRFPHRMDNNQSQERFERANKLESIISKNGFQYLNLEKCTDNYSLNFSEDFQNSEHLNIFGQLKLTDYLGNLIINQYHVIPMKQTDLNNENWNNSANVIEYFNNFMKKETKKRSDETFSETYSFIQSLKDSNSLYRVDTK